MLHVIPTGIVSAANAVQPVTFNQTDAASSTSGLTTYSFAGLSIGTASESRRVVAVFSAVGNVRTASSVTIGGVSATVHVDQQGGGSNDYSLVIASAIVPTGTTATASITWSGSRSQTAVVLYELNGSALSDTASAGEADRVVSVSIDRPENGVVIAGAIGSANSGITWTGATEQTDIVTGPYSTATAADQYETAAAGQTITADGGNPSAGAMAHGAVAFEPA